MKPLTQEEYKDFTTLAREYEKLSSREHSTSEIQTRLEQISNELQEKWGIWLSLHSDYGYVWRDKENEVIRPLDSTSGKTHFNGPYEPNPNFGNL